MWGDRSKKYLEVYVEEDKSYFDTDDLVEEIRKVLHKNVGLANVKIRLEFFTKRCASCGRELKPSMCYEYSGKTYCGQCKGEKNDFHEVRARRFQL